MSGMNGWIGTVLRINLTTSTITKEPLNAEWAKDYVGGRGLGVKYLSEEMDPTVDPLSPDNKMIFATGGGSPQVQAAAPITPRTTLTNR